LDRFDSLIYPLSKSAEIIKSFGIHPFSFIQTDFDQGATIATFIREFEASRAPFAAANELMKTATSGPSSIAFNAPSNDAPLILYTPLEYSKGSSISHLDYDTYVETPEFIMIPQVFFGRTLEEIIATMALFHQ
jgi:hypothetical protein